MTDFSPSHRQGCMSGRYAAMSSSSSANLDARNYAEELAAFVSKLSQIPDREAVASEIEGRPYIASKK